MNIKHFRSIVVSACLGWLAPSLALAQPVITTQPQNQTNAVGTTASFTVEATGTAPLAYQWQKHLTDWSALTGRTNATLVLSNVQTSDEADYRVAVTNADGATSSAPAHLYVLLPPKITPTTNLQHQAVHVGSNAFFAATASGTAPLAYQWWLDGRELPGQTNNTITFGAVQPTDEGDYTVVITNLAGAAASEPARLWVVPPPSAFIRGDFTNGTYRIPYYYLMPTNYSPAYSYPLVCLFHGLCGDEITFTNVSNCNGAHWPGYANFAETKVFASYRQQERDPAFVLWPTYTAGNSAPGDSRYLQQMTNLLADLTSRFNIDTNRVYVGGMSSGDVDGWDTVGLRPGFYAGWLLFAAGDSASTPARVIKDVPLWSFCAQNDEYGNLPGAQSAIRSLRLAGGNPIYTEYVTGGHLGSCLMALSTPAMVDWLLAQRRGVAPTHEPLLGITNPTTQAVLFTGAANLNLAGSADAWANRGQSGLGEHGQPPHRHRLGHQRLERGGHSPFRQQHQPRHRHRHHSQLGAGLRRQYDVQRHADRDPVAGSGHADLAGNERGPEVAGRRPALRRSTRHRPGQSGLANHRRPYDQYRVGRGTNQHGRLLSHPEPVKSESTAKEIQAAGGTLCAYGGRARRAERPFAGRRAQHPRADHAGVGPLGTFLLATTNAEALKKPS